MHYKVSKSFMDHTGCFRNPGDVVELSNEQAAKLRRYGLIGTVETATVQRPKPVVVEPKETAAKSSIETAATLKHGKKSK